MRVIAVLPARNEASRICAVLTGIKKTKTVDKTIVVDDASTDNTAEAAKSAGATVIRLKSHGGVGAATVAGLDAALRNGAEIIIFLDADGQHDPKDIRKFIRNVESGADFVLGKRDLSAYPFKKRFGNFMLRVLANALCPTGLSDPECGFRALSKNAAKTLDLQGRRYEICMDFVYNVWKNKLNVMEVPINVPIYYRRKGTRMRTGIVNFLHLLKRRLLG